MTWKSTPKETGPFLKTCNWIEYYGYWQMILGIEAQKKACHTAICLLNSEHSTKNVTLGSTSTKYDSVTHSSLQISLKLGEIKEDTWKSNGKKATLWKEVFLLKHDGVEIVLEKEHSTLENGKKDRCHFPTIWVEKRKKVQKFKKLVLPAQRRGEHMGTPMRQPHYRSVARRKTVRIYLGFWERLLRYTCHETI